MSPPASSWATIWETSVKQCASLGLKVLTRRRQCFLQPYNHTVYDLGESYLHKGEGRGELRWPLDTAFESRTIFLCLSPAKPVSLWGLNHILERVGEHFSGKNCMIPENDWKGRREKGKRQKRQRCAGTKQGMWEAGLTHGLL